MSLVGRLVGSYRVRATVVLAGVVALLGYAVWLDPVRLERHNSGYQLLPPCGFLQSTGYPCPTCFMTRAFVYVMHGRLLKAVWTQPFGALMCVLVVYLGVGAVGVLVTNKPWRPVWRRWPRWYVLGALAGAFLVSWMFKLVCGIFITGEFPTG